MRSLHERRPKEHLRIKLHTILAYISLWFVFGRTNFQDISQLKRNRKNKNKNIRKLQHVLHCEYRKFRDAVQEAARVQQKISTGKLTYSFDLFSKIFTILIFVFNIDIWKEMADLFNLFNSINPSTINFEAIFKLNDLTPTVQKHLGLVYRYVSKSYSVRIRDIHSFYLVLWYVVWYLLALVLL